MRKHPFTPIPHKSFIIPHPPTIIEEDVVKMEGCEWCEEEAETLRKTRVAASDKLMCETCYNLYLDSRMGEFVSRRKRWIDA
jgi:hypothetical protein